MGAGKKYKVIFLHRSFFTFALREESAHTRREKSARALSQWMCLWRIEDSYGGKYFSQALSAAYFFFQSWGAPGSQVWNLRALYLKRTFDGSRSIQMRWRMDE